MHSHFSEVLECWNPGIFFEPIVCFWCVFFFLRCFYHLLRNIPFFSRLVISIPTLFFHCFFLISSQRDLFVYDCNFVCQKHLWLHHQWCQYSSGNRLSELTVLAGRLHLNTQITSAREVWYFLKDKLFSIRE